MTDALFTISAAKTDEDVATVARLFRAYAEGLGIDLAFQGFEAEMAAMPGKYAAPAGVLLLARGQDGAALGCVGLRPLGEGYCEMKRLYVSPLARGMGLGRALVGAVIGEAGRIGYREIRLDTLPSMEGAIALYRKAGFVEIAPYYDTPVAGTFFLARRLGV